MSFFLFFLYSPPPLAFHLSFLHSESRVTTKCNNSNLPFRSPDGPERDFCNDFSVKKIDFAEKEIVCIYQSMS